MERNVKVKFSKDGKSYRFVFANGISPAYYSKHAGMNDPGLNKRKENHLIQQIEFEDVIGQIIGTKGIPYFEPKKTEEIITTDVISCSLFLPLGETVQTAFFKKCSCGGNHGFICCQKRAYAIVDNVEDGLVSLNYLRDQGDIIFPEEYKKVEKEIENFFN